ncbi:6-phosphogluconolactonase [Clostridium acetobutylicum]|uniref:Muconate cycloisomerase related protein, ortholog of YKGB B.subtilis n=1 Tax=Clostridium acetobutylicum (strain ATCC 824 / DSM 792 / JCM 1419 / IAM 19013 / LMG 5710 / NBRC 13948 / NRRL B-527 / VKM B-1787 / 2291 / W) TaxID=272562 RepID=Q97MV5_CLOAB|nr:MULTISPECIES: lactonase family protein [Clostridium]AAK78071.1 Muconate cycloisomerase related protein, ortholog of YKGB B.subtilis [Clostridium acetobutylicum ATCC 824]ADZ19130.1 Muconate cycloisomerase related protein [Clostridium acetobutylicum EA 2018]AEI33433.1 muconate cycloisomerase [Clostridium acetobutylicum DSM 1731]AWV81866.1 muconate cycloisomerase [Clostridium acetobutylicum]MBC2395414.1 lactonase family protein [Clostridium acetobutylicum]
MSNYEKVYIGTYTNGESRGIYSFNIISDSRKTTAPILSCEIENPTYLTFNMNNKTAYSVIKSGNLGGAASFYVDDRNNHLELLNCKFGYENPPERFSGKQPCYVSLDKTNSYLFSVNYHTSRVDVFPIRNDGSIDTVSSFVIHEGFGPNKERQETSHVHCAVTTPLNDFLCVVDLGTDKIVLYRFDDGILCRFNEFKLKPGCGPRHIIFHPNGKIAYIATELSSEVIVLKYSPLDGSFEELQYVSCLPTDYTGKNGSAAIHISRNSNYLYVSNRGHNSISCFHVDNSTGLLTLNSNTSTYGLSPRDFDLSSSGNLLIAANQDSSNLTIFSVDQVSGNLSKITSDIYVPNPVCVKFYHDK